MAGPFLACNPVPVLFHPQLGPDLIIGAGFYLGGGLGWLFLFRRFGFSLRERFVAHGFYGVFIEQQGAVFIAGLAAMPVGALLWLYVFFVYGCMPGFARVIANPGKSDVKRRWWHYPVALMVIAVSTIVGLVVSAGLLDGTVGRPAEQGICAAPWW
ncbi:MAG: hypothetical protein AAGG69_09380 [Pseudomonadota bacterium]